MKPNIRIAEKCLSSLVLYNTATTSSLSAPTTRVKMPRSTGEIIFYTTSLCKQYTSHLYPKLLVHQILSHGESRHFSASFILPLKTSLLSVNPAVPTAARVLPTLAKLHLCHLSYKKH